MANPDTDVVFGKTAEGQLLYDLAFVDRTDTWLARKHHTKVAVIRKLRALSSVKELRKQVERDRKRGKL